MKENDIVVLKHGLENLWAIGIIGPYQWRDEFNDIDGWELGHTRPVKWLYKASSYEDSKQNFDEGRVFARVKTCRTWEKVVRDFVEVKLAHLNDDWHEMDTSYLDKLEAESQGTLELKDIVSYLGKEGLSSDSIREIRDLFCPDGSYIKHCEYSWNNRSVSENETVCHHVEVVGQIWTVC